VTHKGDLVTTSAPIAALTILGILLAVLGLFVGGSIQLTVVGLITVAVAGVLDVALRRSRPAA
jgi:mannose/fructose/N-acetylgalactosamine-specific phosphotransferase system component IIC